MLSLTSWVGQADSGALPARPGCAHMELPAELGSEHPEGHLTALLCEEGVCGLPVATLT